MVWRCHGIPRIYCYYFCLEPTVRRDTWMRMTSVTVMVVFFESGILKVTWSQLCSFSSQLCSYLITPMITNSPFSTITRHIDNSILKDTLQLYILRTWINMRAKSFIKTSVNVTDTGIDEDVWKNIVTQSVHLEEHCTKTETTFRLFYRNIFLTNLVFKFSIVLIGFLLVISTTIYFFVFWYIHLIYYWSWSLSSASTLFYKEQ